MEERTRFSASDLKIEPLDHNLESFSCGSDSHFDELNAFFNNEIEDCARVRYISAYKVSLKDSDSVVAVFTLANDTLAVSSRQDLDDLIEEMQLPSQTHPVSLFRRTSLFPAINIGHLGVRA